MNVVRLEVQLKLCKGSFVVGDRAKAKTTIYFTSTSCGCGYSMLCFYGHLLCRREVPEVRRDVTNTSDEIKELSIHHEENNKQ